MPAIMMADPGGGRLAPDHNHMQMQHQMQQMQVAQAGQMDQEQMKLRKQQDLETLRGILTAWNANRLDLFELSMPNEDLEFTGVMRFYYQAQDLGSGQKVATKCIRVSSTATNKQIIETLIEKFRPDMKMLEVPEYALYEIHESGERRLGLDEKPLLVQLNWHKDDREGRFLLRRIDEASHMPQPTQEDSSFKRKLSKREKKALKKQEKKEKVKEKDNKDESMAEKLYTELPDTSFTRSISNPEAVMRRRRQQKLEKKLQQFRSKDGGPDTGGTLKIYGEALRKDVPYKTLLLSIRDTAANVVLEMLEKYGIDKRECANYCLVQSNLTMPDDGGEGQVVGGGTTREYILEEEECPLNILMHHPASRGAVTFHVRRRPPDGTGPRRRKKKAAASAGPLGETGLPLLVELTPEGGDRVFKLQMSVTEVGSEVGGHGVQLPGLLPRHCVIAHTEGVVTVTPCSPHAEVVVNNQRAVETTILQHGAILRFGRSVWRFIDPNSEPQRSSQGTLPNLPHHGSTATLPGHEQYQAGMRSSTANYVPFPGGPPSQRGKDAILPAVLEFREDTEVTFFNALTIQLDPSGVNFKLAPTYTIYMATRFRASTHYRPELVPEERAVRLTEMLNRVSDMILAVIQQNPGASHSPTLSFWMANASELLHFLKSDRHITAFSLQAQDMLADAVHIAFKQLVVALQSELELVLPSLLTDQDSDGEQSTAGIISVFSSAMGLLRKCRVNAALTIQLFSQLFHFVNMWTFNTIVTDQQPGQPKVNYCTHTWGLRLKRRLAKVEIWAEKQGLELAADCHLARITQAAHLLQARKGTAEDIATLSSTCFKLNSLQLESLLSRYQPADHEAPINNELIDTIVRVAQNTVDELTKGEGRQVRLEEDFVLQLPFLLPEDNYSCDIVRGVPGGLVEFLSPLQKAGLCVMTPQPTSSGYWTIYMDTPPPLTPVPRSPSEMSQVTTNGTEMYEMGHPNGPSGLNGHGPMNGQNGYIGPPNGPMGHNGPPMNGPMGPKGPAGFNGQMGHNGPHKTSQIHLPEEPEIQTIRLSKTNGMGLSIVAAKGVGKERLGIYIKAVVEGGAAWQDGSLQAGDQLLAVDGQSLVGITQERAAEIMMRTGPVVTLEVAKQGAYYHGLAQLLSQPSPVMSRHNGEGPSGPGYGTGPRRMSERDIRGGPMGPPGPPPPHHHPNIPPQHMMHGGPPPVLPGRIPQSKSTPSLNASPGGDSQHNYQNQEWLHHQIPPRQPPNGPGSRSTSIQNLSQPMTRPPPHAEHEQGFYQNLVPPGPQSQGGPPPFHRPRFGSQTSLSGPPGRDRPMSSHYPMGHPGQPSHPQLTPQGSLHGSPLHQMGPNGPQGSFQRYPGPPGPRPVQPPLSSSGPEKPQRQFSYELDGQMRGPEGPMRGPEGPMRGPDGPMQANRLAEGHGKPEPIRPSQNRVRFQDPSQESNDLSQLRLSAVEQEFRRRVEEYTSDSEDEEAKMSTIKRNGNIANNVNQAEKDREALERRMLEERDREKRIEEKRKELEENARQEERLLNEARRRSQTVQVESNGSTPPPLPSSPPPVETPPPAQAVAASAPGTQRLDMLLGNTAPAVATTLGRSKPKSETPTKRDKRVSFMPEEASVTKFEYSSDPGHEESAKYDDNDNNISQENLDRLNAKEDPNAFIHEAENLLNSATIGLNKMDFNTSSTGHTPSVIGTQEIYKDPRSRMLLEQQEKKLSAGKPPDGAKLSFKEKMKLFAQEVGENTPRDKAKISKAQREIDD